MKPNNLVGRFFRVVEADDYRLLLEADNGSGSSTNKFVLVEASVDGQGNGTLEVSDLVKK